MNREHKGKQFGPALLWAVLALFSCVGSARGQYVKDLPPPPPPNVPKPTPTPALKDEDFEVIKVSSNLVMVPVSVVDASGQAFKGLQAQDFKLDEEGRAQQIVEIGNPDEVQLDIAILFDISSSTSQKGFFQFQQRAAASFLKQVLKPADRAAIFTIAQQPNLVTPFVPADIAAARMLTIPAATTPVPTAFYDTVLAATKYLVDHAVQNHRLVILVISDGEDNYSEMVKDLSLAEYRANQKGEVTKGAQYQSMLARKRDAVLEVQKAVQKSDAAFYSINPGGGSVRLNQISMQAQTGMETIAKATGGTAFLPDGEKDLERVFNEVAAELRGQYLLQYYSNSQATGNQFRRILVSLPTRADLRVRARQGYYPKAK